MSAKQETYYGAGSVRRAGAGRASPFRACTPKLLFLLFAVGASMLAAPPAHAQGIFGSKEVVSDRLDAFTKWTGMLARLNTAAGSSGIQSGDCKPNPRFLCWEAEEEALVAAYRDAATLDKLDAVNRFVNRVPYVEDLPNWGVADHWATPAEFFAHAGDCEDFSIAKYVLLKRLGLAPEKMRVVVLEDLNLVAHHAVLAVDVDGTNYILDNQISVVVPDTVIVHYRPIYSINESHWWLHLNDQGQPLYSAEQP